MGKYSVRRIYSGAASEYACCASKKSLYELTFYFTHIGVIRFISDRVGVMYLGSLVEETETAELFRNPLHPYTKALFNAMPDPYVRRRESVALNGEQPVRTEKFVGCAFCARCEHTTEKCRNVTPEFIEIEKGHRVACHCVNEM